MSQNNGRIAKRLKSWLPYLLLLLWFAFNICAMLFGGGICGDFEATYYIPGKTPSNQFPLIIWKQLELFDILTPGVYNVVAAGYVFGFIWNGLILLAALLITHTLIKRQYSPYPFILPLIILISPPFVSTYLVSLDLALTGLLLLTLAMIFRCSWQPSKAGCGLATLLLCLAIAHRHNAILLLPVILFYIAYVFFPHDSLKILLTKTFVGTLCAGGLIYIGNYMLCELREGSNETVMMQSDLYCMSMLEKKDFFAPVRAQLGEDCLKTPTPPGDYSGTIRARYGMSRNSMVSTPEGRLCKDVWKKEVPQHLKSFITTRFILYSQFVFKGKCPDYLYDIARTIYPHAKFENGNSHHKGKWAIIRLVGSYAYLISMFILAGLLIHQREALKSSPILQLSAASYTTSLVYLISFIPFTPTVDPRYLAPCFATWALCVATYLLYRSSYKKKMLENSHPGSSN